MSRHFWLGFWRLADPKISLASFAGLFLGTCVAAAHGVIDWVWLFLTVLGVFCVEVAKNAAGEVVDYDSGTDLAVEERDRSPFSGGKRVMVDGLLVLDTRVLSIGLIGMALAWYYHGGSIRLSYRGLGELAVALAYGPVIVCGTYLVQQGHLYAPLLQASMALGLLIAAFLWINEFPDYRADKQAGKNNLVVRLGLERAAQWYVVILATGYLWLLLTVIFYPQARGMAWGLAGALPATFSAWRTLESGMQITRLIPAQAACLASFILMALGSGLGYLLGG